MMAAPDLSGVPVRLAQSPPIPSPGSATTNLSSPALPSGRPASKPSAPSPWPKSQSSTPSIAGPDGAQPANASYFPSQARVSPATQLGNSVAPAPARNGSAPPFQAPVPTPRVVQGGSLLVSPTLSHSQLGPHGHEHSLMYPEIATAIKKVDPSVLRQAIRDHWERCVLGSDYHMAFLLNATLHQASEPTLRRAVQDFGGKMVKASKATISCQLDVQDLDDIADEICSKASSTFLDKALARRLESIDARQLINALARAGRLGYDEGDIVEQNGALGREQVIPSMQASSAPYPPLPPVRAIQTYQQYQPKTTPSRQAPKLSTQAQPNPHGIVFCSTCQRPCSGPDALNYHKSKDTCNKPVGNMIIGKDICPHCGSRFGSSTGLTYHLKSHVCGVYTPEVLKATIQMLESASRPASQGIAPRPAHNSSTLTGVSTPSGTADPYAQLTPEMRRALEKEIAEAEQHYGRLMRKAKQLPEPEQSKELSSLKNRFNTRQSTTRKKFGVRLREKRTREEIDAERARLFGTPDGPALWDTDKRLAKKARLSEPREASHETAREAPPTQQADTPRKRVPIGDMGGLAGSSATAELTDPTAAIKPPQPRFANQQPTKATATAQPSAQAKGTSENPMPIDSPSSEEESDNSSDSSSDDEDIPAQLPASHH